MKKGNVYALAAVLILVVAVSAFVAIVNNSNTSTAEVYGPKKPFYLGVTYCGSSVDEAKQLVDKVNNYTNLFVVQSYYLQNHMDELNQVCDYAVNNDLDIIVYFGAYHATDAAVTDFLGHAQTQWGSHFLGLYYNDEPGGKMLDAQLELGNVTKYEDGGIKRIDHLSSTYEKDFLTGEDNKETYFSRSGKITVSTTQSVHKDNGDSSYYYTTTMYELNGTIQYLAQNIVYTINSRIANQSFLKYHPDGTVEDENGTYVFDKGDFSQFTPYKQLWDSRPMQTYTDAANTYLSGLQQDVDFIKNQSSTKVLTADYALYWFDYKGGYDTVLAELGPANNSAQEIALIRGAANMQNKQWGTILSWTNSQDPASLMSGSEMYETLKLSYESGADYGVVFNYAPDSNGTGLLQDEHFTAIKQFWTEVVQNPDTTNNLTVRTAYVLPADYGWGMRTVNDTIWGLFPADEKATEIWSTAQNLLSSTNGKIDIIYEDSASQAATRYSVVHYWNST